MVGTRVTRVAVGLATAFVLAWGGLPASPAEANPAAPLLGPGSNDRGNFAGVSCVQHGLNVVGGAGLVEDGVYGARTTQAVRNFQTFFRLGVDGIVGRQTGGLLDYLMGPDQHADYIWALARCWNVVPTP
jgi:peptidoglycan hydrolase-like protein with peptidoglycan-binding domain